MLPGPPPPLVTSWTSIVSFPVYQMGWGWGCECAPEGLVWFVCPMLSCGGRAQGAGGPCLAHGESEAGMMEVPVDLSQWPSILLPHQPTSRARNGTSCWC